MEYRKKKSSFSTVKNDFCLNFKTNKKSIDVATPRRYVEDMQ